MKIEPSILEGALCVPASKSIGHRMLICAALAQGESQIRGLTENRDVRATMGALKALGAVFHSEPDAQGRPLWRVRGIESEGGKALLGSGSETVVIHCGESGSTLRFLIPVAMSLVSEAVFTGENRLKVRPIDEYFPILKANGVEIGYEGALPLELKGSLGAGSYSLSGRVSSQFLTGMLLAAPLLEGKTLLTIEGEMESWAYVELTLDCLKTFGIEVANHSDKQFTVQRQRYAPRQVTVEGDFSQAAFWIVAGLIGTQPIHLLGLNPDSVQGDRSVLSWVSQMGGRWHWVTSDGEAARLVIEPSETSGMDIDASQCPDLIPIMCVLAALSSGVTRVYNGKRLRLKESDRIAATVSELKKLGADIEETQDGMVIRGKCGLSGGCQVEGWNDHRIVMALAIASTRCDRAIELVGHQAIEKSYPDFFEDFARLGGKIST